MNDSFSTRDILEVNGKRYQIPASPSSASASTCKRLPYSMKILLENLLRHEDGVEHHREGNRSGRELGREEGAGHRNRVHAGARRAAGFHRRARASSTSPRCAMR